MRCSCCNAIIGTGQAKCTICGFPLLIGGNDNEMSQKLIHNHKSKKIGSISIMIKTYSYEMDEKNILKEEAEYYNLAFASELKLGEIQWMDSEFEPLESARDIELTLQITNNDQTDDKTVLIHPEKIISHSRIGVMLSDGFTIQIAVGSKEEYVLSEALSLI